MTQIEQILSGFLICVYPINLKIHLSISFHFQIILWNFDDADRADLSGFLICVYPHNPSHPRSINLLFVKQLKMPLAEFQHYRPVSFFFYLPSAFPIIFFYV